MIVLVYGYEGSGDGHWQRWAAATLAARGAAVTFPELSDPATPQNYDAASRGVGDITNVVIHTTEGSFDGTLSWFQDPAAQVSAHYVTRSSDGHIVAPPSPFSSSSPSTASCRRLGAPRPGHRSDPHAPRRQRQRRLRGPGRARGGRPRARVACRILPGRDTSTSRRDTARPYVLEWLAEVGANRPALRRSGSVRAYGEASVPRAPHARWQLRAARRTPGTSAAT